MAEPLRHAAWQTHYEVHEVLEGDCTVDLGSRFSCTSYEAAVEFVFEFLAEHDPVRSGEIEGLEIVRVAGDRREPVWSYRHSQVGSVPDLVSLWGFDPTRHWLGPPAYRQ
jgi:hypothetical protein